MELNAIEPSIFSELSTPLKLLNEQTRVRVFFDRCDVACIIKLAELATSGTDWAGSRYGPNFFLQGHIRVRHTANVPQLGKDEASSGMDRLGDFAPPSGVLFGVDSWSMGPLGALLGNQGSLSEDKASTSALTVV